MGGGGDAIVIEERGPRAIGRARQIGSAHGCRPRAADRSESAARASERGPRPAPPGRAMKSLSVEDVRRSVWLTGRKCSAVWMQTADRTSPSL